MASKFIRNLQIGFTVSFLLLILSSAASYISIEQLLTNQGWVKHSLKNLKTLDDVHLNLKDKVIGMRGFLLTREDAYVKPYYNSRISKDSLLSALAAQVKDNPVQVENTKLLASQFSDYDAVLEGLITQTKTKTETAEQIDNGRQLMERIQRQIVRMKDIERKLLEQRLLASQNSSTLTPILLIVSAIISLIITLVFYIRIRNDFNERERLKQSLLKKDQETSDGIKQIEEIAHQISIGNYATRVDRNPIGLLAKLSESLNNMAVSLETSFTRLNDNEWLQKGLADLNEKLVGNKTVDTVCEEAINHLIGYGECANGAIYLYEDGKLMMKRSYAREGFMKPFFEEGEGLVGQVFKDKKMQVLNNLDQSFTVSTGTGTIQLSNLLLCPISVDNIAIGVVEVGSHSAFTETDATFHSRVAEIMGIAISSARSRRHIQDLLEETQAQTEELQAQHSELESLNTELEAQTQKLQASEEELKVQQEELLQSNKELEERSAQLEEKNSEIVERNAEIQRKAEELALSTKYKSEFLANMSHELRTPLNSILLLSRLTAENPEGNLTEEQIESAKVIQSSGNGLLALIDEILDLSKIESGKMEVHIEPTPINTITTELKNLFTPTAKDKNIAFEINVHTERKEIDTDFVRLGQILKNLLSNAIKFTEHGGVTLDIEEKGKHIVFKVTDTGIGIAEDKQRIIFEAFQQADGTTRRKFGGTGLGLSISRELVKLLGGTIMVESNPGKGSRFIAKFPLNKADLVPVQDPLQSINENVEKAEQAATNENYVIDVIPEDVEDDRANIKDGDNVILIVEDDTIFAKTLLNYARKSNYKGIVAVRGDLALPATLQFKPKAILLDIQLPIMDGWMVMDQLKSHPETKHIPVHIMSSLQAKKESLLKGAVDFINKPFAISQMSDVFKKIEDALNRGSRKVLIIEENNKHANALSYFLGNFDIHTEIKNTVADSAAALQQEEVNCVILDMGVPYQTAYETLEAIRQNPGLENLPIIIFTGKNISKVEEMKIKKYADSIIIKTAHSYQRVLDEVGLFLHLIDESKNAKKESTIVKLGTLTEVVKDKTVLIADDDVRNIFSLSKALEQHGMKVISAIDGKEAIARLEENPQVDIILMDIMMPEMDGYETISKIREIPKYKHLPIFAVTAKAMTGDREKCIKVGASDYISKPVDVDQLLSLLRVWLYKG
ncbi:histidine kinase [Pelobium manganitolerans]|uniref:histidine kinase n=1 Tax=Pelobium manganitolerans TaxID=1842495 RepID=A0A419S367_9SPHI|nr:response regulator [Pelobium manganitolerans]RKD13726.1 histidine kinase [Pelobium manganitolerans]